MENYFYLALNTSINATSVVKDVKCQLSAECVNKAYNQHLCCNARNLFPGPSSKTQDF